MSRQLTFSATVCALTMALFAAAAGIGPTASGPDIGANGPFAVDGPLAIGAAIH